MLGQSASFDQGWVLEIDLSGQPVLPALVRVGHWILQSFLCFFEEVTDRIWGNLFLEGVEENIEINISSVVLASHGVVLE